MLVAKVKRTRKVSKPEEETFFRFEDFPQPKYGIKEHEFNEIICNIVKFRRDVSEDADIKNKLTDILADLKNILGVTEK